MFIYLFYIENFAHQFIIECNKMCNISTITFFSSPKSKKGNC